MRVFLIVLDSVGIGNAPDALKFHDEGSNTLNTCYKSGKLNIPQMQKLGIFNIDGNDYGEKVEFPVGAYARLEEKSNAKDTTVGHWEIAGLVTTHPFPTYPNGFPREIISEFERRTGRKVICNKPYSGTEVIKDYGDEHFKTGDLIVYTSADSVFQIATHENVVSVEDLYKYCKIAREILVGEHAVGRVIARPFIGDKENGYVRTANRKDFSVQPPKKTMLDYLKDAGKDVIGIGKISDIFGGKGLTESVKTKSDSDGVEKTLEIMERDFDGLCFVNLVDFDAVYGHRNDIDGYTENLNRFDLRLKEILDNLKTDDILMITADHGCDPSTPSTDHSRECVPLLIFGEKITPRNLGTVKGFSCIAKTICQIFNVDCDLDGESLL